MDWIWDPEKDRLNQRKHGIAFEVAIQVFNDPLAFSEQDRHENGEERWQTVGMINGVTIILVAHTFPDVENGAELLRIISARRATPVERKRYEQERLRYL